MNTTTTTITSISITTTVTDIITTTVPSTVVSTIRNNITSNITVAHSDFSTSSALLIKLHDIQQYITSTAQHESDMSIASLTLQIISIIMSPALSAGLLHWGANAVSWRMRLAIHCAATLLSPHVALGYWFVRLVLCISRGLKCCRRTLCCCLPGPAPAPEAQPRWGFFGKVGLA
jgi:hypothetical protein